MYCRVLLGIAFIQISNRIAAVKYTCSSTDNCSEIHFPFGKGQPNTLIFMSYGCCAMPREMQPQTVRDS